jgi:hypothetical protein
MSEFFRHVAAGDKLSVLFRYHKGKADLEVTTIDIKKSLRGSGELAEFEGYSIESVDGPELRGYTLYVRGTDSSTDHDVSKYIYDCEEQRDEALVAFCTMIAEINSIPADNMIPESLGGIPRADGTSYVAKSKSGGDSMFSKSGTLQNVLGGEVKVLVPGFNASNVAISRPKDKDFVMVVITDKEGKVADKFDLSLLPGYAASIKADCVDGILTIKATYDRGAEIPVGNGVVAE